jgi:hypothetical protein
MKAMLWLLVLGIIAGFGYWAWRMRERWQERSRASEERFAALMAQARPAGAPVLATPVKVADEGIAQQRLLLEAAAKAGEAGEPALCIQLYARLLARYPQTAFADQARAAVEAQKKRLAAKPS